MAKKKDPNAPSISTMWRRYLAINRSNAGIMALSLSVTVAASLFIGLRSYLYGALIDQAQQGLLAGFAGVLPLLLAQIAFMPLELAQGLLNATFTNRSLTRMRSMTFERVAHAQMQTLERHKTGDLLSRVNRDMELFVNILTNFLNWQLPVYASFFIALGISIAVSWQLTLICYIAIPVLAFAMSKTAKPMAKYSFDRDQADGEAMALANNLIGGFALAKAYALAEAMQQRFEGATQRAVTAGIKASKIDFALRPMQGLISRLPYALILGVGAYFVSAGSMEMGGVLTFLLLSDYVLAPMQSLPWMFRNMYEAAGAAQRVFEVWDMPQEEDGKGDVRPDPHAQEPVALDNVGFAYHDAAPLLRGISFSLKPGERVALVGASGCGKSTALKLLLAFYRQQTGSVRVMGGDSRDYSLEQLRGLFSYVGQDAYLFPGTIWENVKMARPEATDEEIQAALRAAKADDLDARAEIGERGNRLSGGQRQRVCIARAMLKNAPILLLDEPTSALDTESEYLVTQGLEELMRGKTVLLVAHRLSAMRGIDRILCIENGQVTEEGTHERLMQRGGLYHRLYQAQTKEEEGAAS